MTASVRLPAVASVSRSRTLFTTRMAVERPAAGSPATTAAAGTVPAGTPSGSGASSVVTVWT